MKARNKTVLRAVMVASAVLAMAGAQAATAKQVVKAKPNKMLTQDSVVTVSGSGFTPGETVDILQCNGHALTGGEATCDASNVVTATTTSKGAVPPTKFTVHAGTIGNGSCGTSAKDTKCYIGVGNQSATEFGTVVIKFKP